MTLFLSLVSALAPMVMKLLLDWVTAQGVKNDQAQVQVVQAKVANAAVNAPQGKAELADVLMKGTF